MEELKVCVDLSNQYKQSLFALYNALREREENVLNEHQNRILGDDETTKKALLHARDRGDFERLLSVSDEGRAMLTELALEKSKMWANGKTLRVKFLGGSDLLQDKVKKYAVEWMRFANISFSFVTDGEAEIRVAFMTGRGSWSLVGTDCLNEVEQTEPTMNFGWFDENTAEPEFSRTIIHEFGHALGCIHEHQSPAGNIQWNRPVVYDYYARTQRPSWDHDKVDRNIFAKFDQAEISNSDFDRKSIMLYPIPAEHTTNGYSVGMNSFLSQTDIDFISRCYPR